MQWAQQAGDTLATGQLAAIHAVVDLLPVLADVDLKMRALVAEPKLSARKPSAQLVKEVLQLRSRVKVLIII